MLLLFFFFFLLLQCIQVHSWRLKLNRLWFFLPFTPLSGWLLFILFLLCSWKRSGALLWECLQMWVSRVREETWVNSTFIKVEADKCFRHLRPLTLPSFIEVVRSSSLWTFHLSSHNFARSGAGSAREESFRCEISSILAVYTSATHCAGLVTLIKISTLF